jgi:spore maturation protein CgeB
MKILYVAAKYDYGDPRRGYSFEHENFYKSLRAIKGLTIVYYDFLSRFTAIGKSAMNRELIKTVEKEQPDLMFVCLYREEVFPQTIEYITKKTKTVTYHWFCDDHYRFESFSRLYAPFFDYVSTTDADSLHKYKSIGCKNVILTQWACNTQQYKKLNKCTKKYGVTFVGQPHSNRRAIINYLRKNKIKVQTFGFGWAATNPVAKFGYSLSLKSSWLAWAGVFYMNKAKLTRVTQPQMIKIFNQTKINLNLCNAYNETFSQIKGRVFEIPGCGGLLMTDNVNHLQKYYTPNKEIIVYDDLDDLVKKINYYLAHPVERERIALAGYQRTIREHTYFHRFRQMWKAMLKNKKFTPATREWLNSL